MRWILWVLLVQFILLNISAYLHADKLSHLYSQEQYEIDIAKPISKNIFAKTWRLFCGYRNYKQPEILLPDFKYSVVNFKTRNNLNIEAWYASADSNAKGTVILVHGLMGNKSGLIGQAKQFLSLNYNVLLADSRAHGNSGGTHTGFGYNETEELKLEYDYLKQKGENRILLWGISMGAVEVIKAVGDDKLGVSGIMVSMPFGSLQDLIKARLHNLGLPKQPFGSLITFWIGVQRGYNGLGFDVASYAKKVDCPVLMQYGDRDQLVSFKETDKIFKSFASKDKKLVEYTNASHQQLFRKDSVQWRMETMEFLDKIK